MAEGSVALRSEDSNLVLSVLTKAMHARNNSYVPYSKKKCGAAILSENGYSFGCTIDNAAYPSGMCAIRVAALGALAEGSRVFKAVGYIGSNPREIGRPCGACLEVLLSLGDVPLYLGTLNQSNLLVDRYVKATKAHQRLPVSPLPTTSMLPTKCFFESNGNDFTPEDTSLPPAVVSVCRAAIDVLKFSACLHSQFPVGAAVSTDKGLYTGTNVEIPNALTLGMCAERLALSKAMSCGIRKVMCIAIVAPEAGDFCGPCGACRQFLAECGNVKVILIKLDTEKNKFDVRQTGVAQLLPFMFNKATLLKSEQS